MGKAQEAWDALNDRQRIYLRVLFETDQQREADYKALVARDWDYRRPARQWRRMNFNWNELGGRAQIAEELQREGVYDSGTGVTLAVLEQRGLIDLAGGHARKLTDDPTKYVWMTPAGRRAAKTGLNIAPTPKRPKWQLKEWQWRELVKVAAAGPDGLDDLDLWHATPDTMAGDPDGTGFARGRGLISQYQTPFREHRDNDGNLIWHEHRYRWHLTDRGRDHYTEHLADYRALYPTIEAPDQLPERGAYIAT